jgi:hypothetical protein
VILKIEYGFGFLICECSLNTHYFKLARVDKIMFPDFPLGKEVNHTNRELSSLLVLDVNNYISKVSLKDYKIMFDV